MQRERFALLDGLRGVAALAVLLFHLVQQHSLTALPYAGLAVDFFYVLSGFVVAFAYEERLRSGGMSLTGFFAVRAKRLYPLIFLGTSLGIMLKVSAALASHYLTPTELVEAAILGLLVLPSFVIPRWPTAYPFNMAAWSLTFEAFVNIVYALIAKRLSNAFLIILVGLGACGIGWLAVAHQGVTGGNNQGDWALGFARVVFPFFAGVLIYRFRPAKRRGAPAAAALLILLFGLLLAAWPGYPLVSALYVLILFPVIVLIGSSLAVPPAIARFCTVAGALSYPVYILQAPLLRIGWEASKRLHLQDRAPLVADMAQAVIVIGFAWLALKFFDEPIQERLRGRWAAPSRLPLSQRP